VRKFSIPSWCSRHSASECQCSRCARLSQLDSTRRQSPAAFTLLISSHLISSDLTSSAADSDVSPETAYTERATRRSLRSVVLQFPREKFKRTKNLAPPPQSDRITPTSFSTSTTHYPPYLSTNLACSQKKKIRKNPQKNFNRRHKIIGIKIKIKKT